MAALIIELQDTANDSGVQWEQFSAEQAGPRRRAATRRSRCTFSVIGRWDDVIDYLRRLSELAALGARAQRRRRAPTPLEASQHRDRHRGTAPEAHREPVTGSVRTAEEERRGRPGRSARGPAVGGGSEAWQTT